MNISMVITEETKWVSYGLTRVLKVWGYNNNATDDRYIQFHAKPAAAIAANDVPALKSLWCGANAPFYWEVNCDLSELSIAISSTEVNYTAITNTGLDLTAQVESEYLVTSDVTLVGDLTSAVASLQVWASASGPKKLLCLYCTNNGGAVSYPTIRASNTNLVGDKTVVILKPLGVGISGTYFFGGGYIPYRKDAAGTEHKGCTVAWYTNGAYSDTPDLTTNFTIMAVYGNA